jgi:peptide/nickel transport system ATP-binding protein
LQRLAIVRVLLAQPRFLVCDEPSSRLDMSIQRLAIDVIVEYAAEAAAAVLLISHDRNVLRKRADRIYGLDPTGRLSLEHDARLERRSIQSVVF